MAVSFSMDSLLAQLTAKFGAGVSIERDCLRVKAENLPEIAGYLKTEPELGFNYLNMITAIDHKTHFELIYRLDSLEHNYCLTLKVECTKATATVPSVSPVWAGADFQEREVFDLFGIGFTGHPDLRRIVLWDGFEGFPLRKDFKDGP